MKAGRDTAYGVAIEPAGRMVVVGETGYMTPGPGDNNIAVLRLESDGANDRSFGAGGVVTTHVPGTLNSSGGHVALGADGSIVVVGRGLSQNAVVRYRPDGSLDASFGGDGTVVVDVIGALLAATVQDDGKVVLMSATGKLARLSADGAMDTTFGSDGLVTLP
jgi:uncharacterized delta-60 repeat protein